MGAERNVRHPFKLCRPDLEEQMKATANDLAERLLLSFRELEACACTLLAVLLTFFATRVAGDEAFCLERLAELRVEDHEGAGDAELDRVGLAHDAATFTVVMTSKVSPMSAIPRDRLAAARCWAVTK
jgi:hypothetical protein